MDVNKELEKWMEEFRNCNTPEQKHDHRKRFKSFLSTLNEEDGRAFGKAFAKKSHEVVATGKALIKEIDMKTQLAGIQDIISFSYIAEHYFGKTRNWLYQRINGNLVNGKPAQFTDEEIKILKDALNDICGKIQNTSRSFA